MKMYMVTVTLTDGRKLSGCIHARSEAHACDQCRRAGGIVVFSVDATLSF